MNIELSPAPVIAQVVSFTLFILVIACLGAIFVLFFYMLFQWIKHHNREKYALKFVTLQVRLPRDNEIKVDAAEQMFSGLFSIKHSGWFHWLKPEDIFTFEIVALKEEIAFYVSWYLVFHPRIIP